MLFRSQTLKTIIELLLKENGDYRDIFTTKKTFLTPEQMDKMHELQKEQMKNKRNNKGEKDGEDPS